MSFPVIFHLHDACKLTGCSLLAGIKTAWKPEGGRGNNKWIWELVNWLSLVVFSFAGRELDPFMGVARPRARERKCRAVSTICSCWRQLPVLVSTVKSCSTGTCRRIHLMVIQKPSGKSWVWWCTKGKGKVNRCTALAPPFWFSSSFRLLLAYKLMMKRRASRREAQTKGLMTCRLKPCVSRTQILVFFFLSPFAGL